MNRTTAFAGALMILIVAAVAPAAAAKYSIKTASTPAPKELKEPLRMVLTDQAIQLLDEKGTAISELWR